jgi:AAA domain, putative AbiEii toxin, Type IV TA system
MTLMNAPEALIARFRLADVRGFRELELDLRDPQGRPRRRLLVVGQNGTCKTTLLRAIAVGICDLIDTNGLLALPFGGLVSREQEGAEIQIELSTPDGLDTESRVHMLRRSGEKEFAEDGPHGPWDEVVRSEDELDQHLHPSLQSRILGHLAELLPHVQLIATTHSPLVALGAKPEELLVLQRHGAGVARVENPPDFSHYSAEDMLEDERLFDTSPYSPATEELLRSYNELIAIPKRQRSPSQGEELARLARELRKEQLIPPADSDVTRELHALIAKHGL